jgi:cytochrome P450
MTETDAQPTTDLDLFGLQVGSAPERLRPLQDLAPAVFVPEHDFWVLTRYDDVRAAAADWETFSSAQGVALLDEFNAPVIGGLVATDPPEHDAIRAVLSAHTSPRAIASLQQDVARQVDAIVDDLLRATSFDGVTELAQRVPLRIVGDLLGLPEEGRDRLIPGADAINMTFGPLTPRLQQHLPIVGSYFHWIASVFNRETLRPGSWGAAILDAVDDGRLSAKLGLDQLNAFMVAGFDTTANAVAAMLRLFAEQPRAWAALQDDPSLARPVFEETLRMWSPIKGFFRVTTRDVQLGDVVLPAGTRVLLHFAAANRDERHYPDPDTFDVARNPVDHLSFGYGVHGCLGQALARLEARSVIDALLRWVDRFELAGEPVVRDHPVINGLGALPLRVHLKNR